MTNEEFLEMLTRHEGNVPYAYQDSLGYWTIGVGFLIDKRKGGLLYPEEIEFILGNRVDKLVKQLTTAIPWLSQLSPNRQAVLTDMAFNLGVQGLLKFKNTLELIRTGQYEKASKAMLQSLWAKQVGKRATELAELMKNG